MSRMRAKAALLLIWGCISGLLGTEVRAQIDTEGIAIEPIPEVQAQIEKLAVGVTSRRVLTEIEFENGLAVLLRIANSDRKVVLEQMLYYHGVQRRWIEKRMAADLGVGVIYNALGYSDHEIIIVVYPLMRDSDSYWSARIARSLLDEIGTNAYPEGPDFAAFEEFIRENALSGEDDALIRYMFKRSPVAALHSMRAIIGGSLSTRIDLDIALATLQERFGHSLNRYGNPAGVGDTDAIETLDTLSSDPIWWVRLFAASTLLKQPDFAISDSILVRLKSDSHPSVRAMAEEVLLDRIQLP